jgi:hypothetical protein|tara:strand:- start:203 stop:394 length:192 start_codon:yes stop_codon:yes gene_type:complete
MPTREQEIGEDRTGEGEGHIALGIPDIALKFSHKSPLLNAFSFTRKLSLRKARRVDILGRVYV